MNIKQAWRALWGQIEPREVFSEVVMVKAYLVTDWRYIGHGHFFPEARRYYATCTQAYTAESGRRVEEVQLLNAGGVLYRLPKGTRMYEVALQPKSKRPKGRAR